MLENLLVKGGKMMFILAYSVISFIVLLSLFLKHKYQISGMGIVLLLLIFVLYLLKQHLILIFTSRSFPSQAKDCSF